MNESKREFAKIVVRRGPSFPFRNARYFDFTPWRGGYVRAQGVPGAVVLSGNVLGNLSTGEVYTDERFSEAK